MNSVNMPALSWEGRSCAPTSLIDPMGRLISYLRLSVTDRCNLRCRYCLGPDAAFAPKNEVLALEELERLCDVFIRLGIRKLRLTGGEPLVRRGILGMISRLGAHVAAGRLDELTMTTNGVRLASCADALWASGVRRINVSLDSLNAETFHAVTRRGNLPDVLAGIAAAQAAGIKVKINTLVLKGLNDLQIDDLIAWCGCQGLDLTLIELMPLGGLTTLHSEHYLSFDELRQRLSRWSLIPVESVGKGPARFFTVAETGGRLGLISALSHGFCKDCNRLRLTCTGRLYMCLGREDYVDLTPALHGGEGDGLVEEAIRRAVDRKIGGHGFLPDQRVSSPALGRGMNVTGG